MGLAASSPGSAFTLLIAYSLGLGLPFLIVGLFASRASGFFNKYGRALSYATKIFGLILIVLGVLSFTQRLSRIANLELFNSIFPRKEVQSLQTDKLRVRSPLPNSLVSSPLNVTGEASGLWYFEASFPIRLYDAAGRELAVVAAQAQGEWMTEEFVPFQAMLTFPASETDKGTLVFERDNPSGLPQYAEKVSMLLRFR